MKINTIAAILLAMLAGAALPATAEEEAMTRMVFRFVAKGLDPASFAATPREMWRVGTTRFRLEEEPNPDTGAHALVIKNAPHSWIVDRLSGEAIHSEYRGSDSAIQVPLFPGTPSVSVQALEFGHEAAFFRERGAKTAGSGIVGGRHATASVLVVDGIQLTLYTGDDGRPWQVAIRIGAQEWAIRYEAYETGLAIDPALFRPPEGVTIVEAE